MEKSQNQTKHSFYKEIKTDDHLSSLPKEELITIIQYQNQRLTDLNFKLGTVESLLERIFRLNLLIHSKLKLDVCTYMASKKGVSYGQEKFKDSDKENNFSKQDRQENRKDFKRH